MWTWHQPERLSGNWAWDFPDIGACPLAVFQVPFKTFTEKEKTLGYDCSDLFQMPSSWQNEVFSRSSYFCKGRLFKIWTGTFSDYSHPGSFTATLTLHLKKKIKSKLIKFTDSLQTNSVLMHYSVGQSNSIIMVP